MVFPNVVVPLFFTPTIKKSGSLFLTEFMSSFFMSGSFDSSLREYVDVIIDNNDINPIEMIRTERYLLQFLKK